MPHTLSTQKRARLAQVSAPMPIWTLLPYDLVHSMGERLVADNDIDTYMAFREVCHEWRSITKDDPTKVKAGDDTNPVARFEPTKWALLDHRDDLIMLVNVDTGRFLYKRIPLLRKFFFVGATRGGLILLGESSEPHRARILNPFTGSIAHFRVRIPCEGVRAVAMTTKPSLTVFISIENGNIMWADQSMETFKQLWIAYPNRPSCMTSFGDNVYTIDRYGSIYLSTVTVAAGEPSRRCAMEMSMEPIFPSLDISAQVQMSGRYYLVESMGDLLLVTRPSGFTVDQPVVRRVNTETKTIEPVSSIGSRALFVSHGRCLSVDANKFPSILGGCVYFLEAIVTRGRYAFVDRTIVHVADNIVKFDWFPQVFFRPFTLTKVLTDYCRSIHYSELCEMMFSKWDRDVSDDDDSESDESSSSELDDDSESDESSSSELDDEESSSSKLDDEERSSSEPVDD